MNGKVIDAPPKANATVLVVEDDAAARQACRILLEDAGYRVQVAANGEAAIDALRKECFRLVLADLRMPGMNGLDLIDHVSAHYPGLAVVMMTAYGTAQQESRAYSLGVGAFLAKPFTEDEMLAAVEMALDRSQLAAENRSLKQRLEEQDAPHGIIGKSAAIGHLLELIDRAATTDCTVLITGESGTGKELVAQAIHRVSRRNKAPFLAINCGAVPETLLESQLFGYVRGAFTGAVEDAQGILSVADHGTLFLDEIGDLAPCLQVKLLRVLQEKEYVPLGTHTSRPVDVRILAATHKDLREETLAGRFREDLYYRLEILPIHIPPLRERAEDIPLLAEHFLASAREDLGEPNLGFSRGALARMIEHPWPGNVRELQNAVTRAAVLAEGDGVDPIPRDRPSLMDLLPREHLATQRPPTLSEVLAEAEKAYLVEILDDCEGNQVKAAAVLGITRRTLYNKLQQHDLRKSFRSK